MSYIKLADENLPGISGLLKTYTDTAKPLGELAQTLLQKTTDHFSIFERELLASYVSYLNGCVFCSESHGAVANYHSEDQMARRAWENPTGDFISEKVQHILKIGSKIQSEIKPLDESDIVKCREFGMSDTEINDMCLIASAFCMYNRYVESLGTKCPPAGHEMYAQMGKILAEQGYTRLR